LSSTRSGTVAVPRWYAGDRFLSAPIGLNLLGVAPKQSILASARLVAGDTVALVSPASWSDEEWIAHNVALLEAWGLRLRIGRHARDRLGYLAGRDRDRAADVNAAIADPQVRAVVALFGGCGSLRVLRDLDVAGLRRDPKPLIGFSDITALHRVWHAAGVASLHGCLDGTQADEIRAHLFGGRPVPVEADPDTLTAALTTTGTATGVLFGGNLEMLARSIGILNLDLRGHILMLEAHRAAGLGMVDRALTQLILSGSLDEITGIAVGRVHGFEGHRDREWTILDLLHDRLDQLGVPILGGLPIGHGDDPRTVPLGVRCHLDADNGLLTAEPAVT